MVARLVKLTALAGWLAISGYAADKTLMHCFAWTPIKDARRPIGRRSMGQVQLGNVDKETFQK